LIPDDATVRAGLNGLSGEIHGTVFTALLDDAAAVENAARTRLLDRAEGLGGGLGVWATGLRRWSTNKGGFTQNAFGDAWGVVGGFDAGLGESFRLGLGAGQTWTDLTTNNGIGSARAETTHVLAYAGGNWNGVRFNVTAGYAWSDVTTRRSVAFFGFADSLSGAYKARTFHGGADLGYQLPLGGGSVEPFAAVEVYNVRRDAFAEAGGAAALSGLREDKTNTVTTLGARFSTPITDGLSARGQLGWRHTFGDLVPVSAQRFAGGGVFGIQGAPLNEDAAAAEIALRYAVGNVALTGSYNGIIGKNGDDSRFQLGLSIGF
jgi:outer membrane autotransporter protein